RRAGERDECRRTVGRTGALDLGCGAGAGRSAKDGGGVIGLVSAKVFHARLRPRRNRFRYAATYLTIPLKDFAPRRAGLFSIDYRNLFGLRRSDYGDGGDPARWIAGVLKDWSVRRQTAKWCSSPCHAFLAMPSIRS